MTLLSRSMCRTAGWTWHSGGLTLTDNWLHPAFRNFLCDSGRSLGGASINRYCSPWVMFLWEKIVRCWIVICIRYANSTCRTAGDSSRRQGISEHSELSMFGSMLTRVQKVRSPNLFKEKYISDVVRIDSIIIYHLSKLWNAKFSIMCGVIVLVRVQEKFEVDHSWEWKG